MSTLLSQLIQAVGDTVLTRYITYSALTVTTYDAVLTLPDSITLFKRSKLSLGRVLYYLTRIAAFVGLTLMSYHISEFRPDFSRKWCQVFVCVWPWCYSLTMLATDWLLTLRIGALYHAQAIVWRGAYASLIISTAITFGTLIPIQVTYTKTIYYIEVVRLCGVLTQGRDVVKTFYPLLAHETILTIIMGVHTWRNFKRGIGGPSLPLLTVLYRDGALFYLIVLGLRIWIIYTLLTMPLTQLYLNIAVIWAACTLLTARAYLNLCSIVLFREQEGETSVEMNATIGFAPNRRQSHAPLSPTEIAFDSTRVDRLGPIRPTEVYFHTRVEVDAGNLHPPMSPLGSSKMFDEERRLSGTSMSNRLHSPDHTDDHTTA